ncbi:unnamed protein product [Hyaloperonospora brassicae]|uniref:HTH myb-type domain-containing protein n=1 Tax=Hyaloperonospora brassicae TaxID=162125 RepID=A0AAV0TXU4_HYABA|nr:unnamed protein product [Hyaloperonospora brassicae]
MDRVKRAGSYGSSYSPWQRHSVASLDKVRAHQQHTASFVAATRQTPVFDSVCASSAAPSAAASALSMKQEAEPWSSSSRFGLANILNRTGSSASGHHPMPPAFSLPSLHGFETPQRPAAIKQEMPAALPPYEENHYVSARTQQHHPLQRRSVQSSPVRDSPSPDSRRVGEGAVHACGEDASQDSENAIVGTRGGTITRGGRWSADEHERFLEGFRIHGHKWKRVQHVVRTRSVTQVRTHAQKYLLKVAKLKAEKKQSGKSADMATVATGYSSGPAAPVSLDGRDTAPSTPEQGGTADSPRKTPQDKVRRLDHGSCDPVDQEYIAAAATTLCFLMSQKIDSLFDSRHELQAEQDAAEHEPYDCYVPQTVGQLDAECTASRKRSFMQILDDQATGEYVSSYDPAHGDPSSYTIEGNKLCS